MAAEGPTGGTTVISDEVPASASVTGWVQCLQAGDAAAAQKLWDRYFHKLIAQATKRIRALNCPEGAVIAEDVAASVFESIWQGAQAGRFQNVADRDELWWLLQAMTRRKVVDHIRHATAQRRHPGSPVTSLPVSDTRLWFQELVSDEPTAEYVAMMDEQYAVLLKKLRDDKLRQIAVLKVQGHTNEEIQKRLVVSSATLMRKLRLIRDTWRQALLEQDSGDGNG